MQRRFRLEDADEQIVGKHRVERKTRLDVVAQADLALDHDDRARARGRELRRRDGDLLDGLVGAFLRQEISKEGRAPEMCERAANVSLEQHDGSKHQVRQQVPDEPVDRLQMAPPRNVEHHQQQRESRNHLDGPRAANRLQHLVDHQRHDGDIEDVPPGHGGQARKQWQPVQHC